MTANAYIILKFESILKKEIVKNHGLLSSFYQIKSWTLLLSLLVRWVPSLKSILL